MFFQELSFFYDPMDVGNLTSHSSSLFKASLNIWKFLVYVLMKPLLENFEHYFTSVWDECNCAVVWAFFGIAFHWDWNENWPFSSPVATTELSKQWKGVQHFHSIIFRIWNRATRIPSPSLVLFIVMLPKAHLTSHSRMSSSRWVMTPSWLSESYIFLLCIVATSS